MKQWMKIGLVLTLVLLVVGGMSAAQAIDCTHEDADGQTLFAWKVVTGSTCTVQGLKEYRCSNCKAFGAKEDLPLLPHDPSDEKTVASTCTVAGKKYTECKVCKTELSKTALPLAQHTLGATQTHPLSCTDNEYTYKSCSVCKGEFEIAIVKKATGHSFLAFPNKINDASCTAEGSKEFNCQNAGCTFVKTETIPKAAHTLPAVFTVKTAATCTAAGLEAKKCANCTYEETKAIPAKGHDFSAVGTVVVAATCTAQGRNTITCANGCGTTIEKYTDALGHDFSKTKDAAKSVAPTCKADGKDVFNCTRTGCTADNTVVLKKVDHKYDETKPVTVVTAPSCTKAGKGTRLCEFGCGTKKEFTITATGHTMVKQADDKAATCTADGLQHEKCSNAGCTYEVKKVLAKTGHKYKTTADAGSTVAATCTVAGSEEYTCQNAGCTYVDIRVLKALGHDLLVTVTLKPTCTAEGVQTTTCKRTGCTYSKLDPIKALGHKYIWKTTLKPTNTVAGKAIEICSVCNFESGKTKVLPVTYIYYANTLSLAGDRVRNITTGVTNAWNMVALIDLTVNGTTTVDIVASNLYVVGKLTATVKDGTVTFSVSFNSAVDLKSNYFTLFGSVDEITTLDEKALTLFDLNKAYSIADDLGGLASVYAYYYGVADYDSLASGIKGFTYKGK